LATRKVTDKTVIQTRDLLNRYLGFQGLTPNRLESNVSALAGNPPRLIRYQRLMAMLAPFGVKTDPPSFEKGKFIDANNPAYEPPIARILADLNDSLVSSVERRGASLRYQLRRHIGL